jgi:PPOX class probable F420-dependent enzyme
VRGMTDAEIQDFLTNSPHTGKLATVGRDGQPHVVPIWFVLDGDDVVLTISSSSTKARNIRNQQRVSLCLDDEELPYAFVTVFGTATSTQNPPDLLEWTTRIAARYVGPERSVEFGQRNAGFDDTLVRIRIERTVGYAEITN